MQDDLIERWGVNWPESGRGPVHARMADGYWTPWHIANDRIAALEAKLAEKDALLRECGEALGRIVENEDQYGMTWAAEMARTTLTKIKDATDA